MSNRAPLRQSKAKAKASAKTEKDRLKQLIKDLSPEQRDQLLRKLKPVAADSSAALTDRQQWQDADMPLSLAQEREWFRDRMFPDIAHNISGALRLVGALSLQALSATLEEIVRRHETLRTNISATGDRPQLKVRAPEPFAIDIVESRDWHSLHAEEMKRPFELGSDVLMRAKLVRISNDEHILLLTLHHIAADGWSIGVVMHELAALYTAFVRGRPSPLPALPIQYVDFAHWQRQRVQGSVLSTGLKYWRRQLAELPPVLQLVPDRLLHTALDAADRDHSASAVKSIIDRPLRQGLEALSRAQGTTLFVTLLTAFMTLLMRCTGQQDVVIGSPASGRTHVATEALIGLFLNTLAMRARLAPELTFQEAMMVVRPMVLDAMRHADVPIQTLVEGLDVERGANMHPVYEVVFNFTPSTPRNVELPGIRARLEDPPALTEEFFTQLFVTDVDGVLELDLRYRSARYSDARMECFLEQYIAVLQQVVRDANLRLGALDLVTALSRSVLPDLTVVLEVPRQIPVVDSIAAWAARTPNASAVEHCGSTLTYAELAARITTQAARLQARRGDVVTVTGPRSIDVIVDMAAALAAGGVLLTLSDDLPAHRRQTMVDQAGARFEDPRAAYVFFTSGSTGNPKGVLGTHDGLAHWLDWQRKTFCIGPGDRCAQLTGLSFDVVLRDVFLPLTSGATLVLPVDGEPTLQWLERERVTTLHTVPTVAQTWLLDRSSEVTLKNLRHVFFAGEPLTSSLVERWREAFPQSGTLVNLYGPTETTLAQCFYVVPEKPLSGVQPLGRTIPHAQALVLTPTRSMCGIGEPGEIAIRTPFRTLGYINAPDENAKRFVQLGDDVVYLTGDRGVLGADGLLEFRGRLDNQVKIRGQRVEPMEVTTVLQAHPDVAACAVVARDDGDGPALAAYVVLRPGLQEDLSALHTFLGKRLPAAMTPSAFVFLDALPLTANQKVDRQRLPVPQKQRVTARCVAPRDATELRLVQIWEELLDVHPVGVTDSFFELGGHSLLALRLLVEIERHFGSKVPLSAIFEEPTVEHLASALRLEDTGWPLLVRLRAGEGPKSLFLVHPGGGTLLNYVHLVRHLPAGLPVYGIQARGLDGAREPHGTLEEMARDYAAEILTAQPRGPYYLAGHSMGGVIAFEMTRQLRARGQMVAFLGMFDSVAPGSHREQDVADERREDALRLATMAEAIGRFVGNSVDVSFEALCELGTEAQLEAVVTALKRADALPRGEEQRMLRNLLQVGKAHVRVHRAYRPAVASAPITLFRANAAQSSDYPSASEEVLRDAALGWQSLTTQPVRVVHTSGNHVTMLSSAHAPELADLLRPYLETTLEPRTEANT